MVESYYCDCFRYSGCAKPNGQLDCFICMNGIHYNSHVSYTNYNTKEHVKSYRELVNEFKNNPDVEMYNDNYTEKSFNFREGTQSIWLFFNYLFKTNYLKNKFFM